MTSPSTTKPDYAPVTANLTPGSAQARQALAPPQPWPTPQLLVTGASAAGPVEEHHAALPGKATRTH